MVLVLLVPIGAHAAEGMWLPEQIPAMAGALADDGFTVDPAALALNGAVTGAVVSLGGCTASFVSPDGLLVTNHHCAYRSLQHNSTPERDLLEHGFLAETRKDELFAAPGSYVYVTTGVRDVTNEVMFDIKPKVNDLERQHLVEQRERALIDACEDQPGTRCKVARMFEGTTFALVTQREIQDLRVVYAPSVGIGNFGGEIDNWTWPRQTGDFAFLRAYVGADGFAAAPSPNNVPYHPPKWLSLASEPLEDGDAVMVIGYPGRTSRFETAAELEAAATFGWPESVRYGTALIGLLEARNQVSPAVALANYARIRALANPLKKRAGILAALADGRIEATRREREARISARYTADRKLGRTGDPVQELGATLAERRTTERQELVLGWLGQASPMFGEALALWRMAEERVRPDLEREDGFRDRDFTRFVQARQRAQGIIEPDSDRATLRFLLGEVVALPADQRIVPLDKALAATGRPTDGERIEALLDQLYTTKIADLAVRESWLQASTEQLAATGDPMLVLAGSVAPLLRDVREREERWEGAMLRIRPRYLAALRATAGDAPVYPDANGTLRLTWGRVAAYAPRDAVRFASRTSLHGVLEKATGVAPFAAPVALLEAATHVPEAFVDPTLGTVAVDFVSTCDTTGGNSGSPTLDAQGRLTGLAFDGNLEGIASDHGYDARETRAIHVDAAYIRWVMAEVDHADALLTEMTGAR